MSRLDVAFLVYDVDVTGGMERQARTLATRLAERGARVRLVTCFWVDGLRPRWPRGRRALERRGRLTTLRVPLPRGWGYEGGLAFYELAAAAYLGARVPHVLYAVQWTAGVHASRVAALLGCPFVVKLAGGGQNGDFAAIAKQANPRAILAALERADRIVCVSPQIAAEARAAGFAGEKLLAIPNGVDLARFEGVPPATLEGPADAERVLFVGSLRREKRLPDLVRAFAPVAAKRPLARLVLAGDGPEEAAVRETARALGLESRVDLLGKRGDVPALLAAARVFVLLTESEGLSNALLEALAAGTPVVASNIEGNRYVVGDDREALLVPLEDEAALAQALERVLAEPELGRRLARAGKERVQRYSLETVVASYERELGALARAARARGSREGSRALGLARRYFSGFENPGVGGLLVRGLRHATGRLAALARARLAPGSAA